MKRSLDLAAKRVASVAEEPRPDPSRPVPTEPGPSRHTHRAVISLGERHRSPRSDLQGATRTEAPDLVSAFADAMAELEATLDLVERHGPAYVREYLAVSLNPRRTSAHKPRALPPAAARLIRELADDALVRALSNPPKRQEVQQCI